MEQEIIEIILAKHTALSQAEIEACALEIILALNAYVP
jgi:hypothetical protein